MRTLLLHSVVLSCLLLMAGVGMGQTIPLKKEYATTLFQLSDALLQRQVHVTNSPDHGAITCAHCNVLHTRAAEAVYPFTVAWTIGRKHEYLNGAKSTAAWLLKQQQPDGSWKETPEEWTGTTTDQLLMLLLSYPLLADSLTNMEQQAWKSSMRKAADYLMKVMTPEFASINYVATTTATLAKAWELLGNETYRLRATALAHRTISKMDDDGFLNGEGGRSHKNKMGVDLGYNMEMSLWGLGLYAKVCGDTLVKRYVAHALKSHVNFIYPDGSLDGSWGIRMNKWTMFGSATSDGCQGLFSLFSDDDDRYAAASYKNLQFLRTNILPDGLIGYGPQYAELFNKPPCIYPTFTKAKNLALAWSLEHKTTRRLAPIPTQLTGWAKHWPTLDVVQVRTKNFMATITGYTYKDLAAGAKSKYMYRPTGGTLSYLWAKDFGAVQASSATVYSRPEPMSFPEAPGIITITPRIEYTDSLGYFTNLFEYDSKIQLNKKAADQFVVTATGELKDKNWFGGGVGYRLDYLFTDQYIEKTVKLTWHDAWPEVSIIEPFVQPKGMVIRQVDPKTIVFRSGKKSFRFRITSGAATIVAGEGAEHYWAPYPALKAYPLRIVLKPAPGTFQRSITYRLELLD